MASDTQRVALPEADFSHVMCKVILPNGTVKEEHYMSTEMTIREEKETILRDNGIPYPNLYLMVMLGPQNSSQVLVEDQLVDNYTKDLADGQPIELEIKKKSSEAERPPRAIKPELFNVKMKPTS